MTPTAKDVFRVLRYHRGRPFTINLIAGYLSHLERPLLDAAVVELLKAKKIRQDGESVIAD